MFVAFQVPSDLRLKQWQIPCLVNMCACYVGVPAVMRDQNDGRTACRRDRGRARRDELLCLAYL